MEHRMICLDNSEWMRNGDYNPTRMKAQRDAANIVCTRHLSSNPESTVGIMTLAGPRCTIHCTQCTDNPRLHRAISLDNTPIGGKCRLINGIKIARLALKNRPNQKGEARIVLFVGSPVEEDLAAFQKIGRDLKKNSCAISVILLGEIGDNNEKMEALVTAARKEEGARCDLIVVPPGVTPLEVVRNSPLCTPSYSASSGTTAAPAAAGAATGASGGAEDDIQQALRLSLLEVQGAAGNAGANVAPEAMTEEEQIRRAIELSMGMGAGAEGAGDAAADTTADAGAADGDATAAGEGGGDDDDDDEGARLIQQALAMSTQENNDNEEDEEDDEEAAALAAALAASMAENDEAEVEATPEPAAAPAIPAPSGDANDAGFSDPDYVKTLLASIPGASFDDPVIQAALAEAQKIQSEKNDEAGGDKKDEKEDKK